MAPLPGVQQLQGDITKLATANKYYSKQMPHIKNAYAGVISICKSPL